MADGTKYTFGDFCRDFITSVAHLGTCAATWAIANKDQPTMAALVFIAGTAGTRGVRKEIQARIIELASVKLRALEAKLKEEEK